MSAQPIMIKGNRHQKFPSCLFTAAKVNTIPFAPIISYFHQQKKPLKYFSFSHQSIVNNTDRWERLNVFLMTFVVFFCTTMFAKCARALMFVSPIHSSTLFLMVFYFDDDIASAGSIPIIPSRKKKEALLFPMLFLSSFIIPAALSAQKGDRKKVILVNNFWGH